MAKSVVVGYSTRMARRIRKNAGGVYTAELNESRNRGGGYKGRLFKTPSGGIPAATGSGPYTFGSADCTPVNPDGTVGTGSMTITNIVNQVIAGSVVIKAAKVGTLWVVDVASCGA